MLASQNWSYRVKGCGRDSTKGRISNATTSSCGFLPRLWYLIPAMAPSNSREAITSNKGRLVAMVITVLPRPSVIINTVPIIPRTPPVINPIHLSRPFLHGFACSSRPFSRRRHRGRACLGAGAPDHECADPHATQSRTRRCSTYRRRRGPARRAREGG
jgi:hypothetical protein